MKHFLMILLAGLTLVVSTSSSFAFDGDRKGFVFGAGLGVGYVSIDRTIEISDGDEDSELDDGFGFATRIEAGFGHNQQMIYAFEVRSRWFKETYRVGYPGSGKNSSSNVLTLVGGPTLTYFTEPSVPSFFVGGGPAIVFVTDELNMTILSSGPRNLDAWGPGLVLKCGYEFSRHFDVSFEFVAGFPSETTGTEDMNATLLGFTVSVNWLGY